MIRKIEEKIKSYNYCDEKMKGQKLWSGGTITKCYYPNTKKYNSKKSASAITKYGQDFENVKEIEKTISITEVSSLRLIDSLMLLKDMFNDFKEIDKGDKNYKKYINQIYSEINIIKNNLYELKASNYI